MPERQVRGDRARSAREVDERVLGGSAGGEVGQVGEQQARAVIEAGSRERTAEGADLQVSLTTGGGHRFVSCARLAGEEDAGLLARVRNVEAPEVLAEDVVHRESHVLHPTAGDHDDRGGGVGGDQSRDVTKSVEGAGQAEQDDTSVAEGIGVERNEPDAVVQSELGGVPGDRTLAGEGVLVHADVSRAVVRRRQCESTVGVADDGDRPRGRRGPQIGGLVEDEAIGGIRRHQVGAFDVRATGQPLEGERGGTRHPTSVGERSGRDGRAPGDTRRMKTIARWALAGAMVFAGLSHLFWARKEFQAQVPDLVTDTLPIDKDGVVVASGAVEMMLGAALVVLPKERRRIGIILAAFFVAIFPGNLDQALKKRDGFHLDSDTARWRRLAFQPVLVAWALWSTRD